MYTMNEQRHGVSRKAAIIRARITGRIISVGSICCQVYGIWQLCSNIVMYCLFDSLSSLESILSRHCNTSLHIVYCLDAMDEYEKHILLLEHVVIVRGVCVGYPNTVLN